MNFMDHPALTLMYVAAGVMLVWQTVRLLRTDARLEDAKIERNYVVAKLAHERDALRSEAQRVLEQGNKTAASFREQLAAPACPRCRSTRTARHCANCGRDMLPPGTPLVTGDDGRYRPAREGERAVGMMAAEGERWAELARRAARSHDDIFGRR